MKTKRLRAVCAAVLAFLLLFSVLFIALEAGHDCHGDDCAVCAQIGTCLRLLQQLLLALFLIAAAVALRMTAARIRRVAARFRAGVSLISLKVKLSD